MASMVPYRSVFGIRPTSLFDALDDMMDFAPSSSTRAFPMDVEDKGEGYEVKAYLAGVNKDDIDVELNEGRPQSRLHSRPALAGDTPSCLGGPHRLFRHPRQHAIRYGSRSPAVCAAGR